MEPSEGYKFTAWRTKAAAFCGGSNAPCPLSTTQFTDTPLMGFLETDDVFFLEPVFGQPGAWVSKAAMPTSRVISNSCVVKGKIYVFGGQRVGGGPPIGSVEMYDPVTDRWAQKASLPEPRFGFAASAVKNKCYIFGGVTEFPGSASSSVLEYDPANDRWRSRAAMPTARVVASSAVVDGKVYVVGGWSAPNDTFAEPIDAVEEYDPRQNTWRTRSPMPTARGALATTVVDDQIYAIAGHDSLGGTNNLFVVERFDPVANAWSSHSDIPQARYALGVASVQGRIYTFGGTDRQDQIYDSVEEYNPASDTWRSLDRLEDAKWGAVGSVIDGQIYLMGGSTGHGGHNSLSENNLYTP